MKGKTLWLMGCVSFVSAAAVVVPFASMASSGELDPKELMRQSDERHRLTSEYTEGMMILQAEGSEPQQRTLVSYTLQDEERGDRMLLRFLSPSGIRNTAFLTIEHGRGRANDQWLYLPAFRRTRRLGEAELGDRFVGSDIFFEDLKRRYVDDYSYTLLRTEACGEHRCHVIESIPSDPKVKEESPYSKTQIWLRADNLFPIRTRSFDSRDRPLKEMRIEELTQVHGDVWRADRMVVVDLQRRHRTVMTVRERTVNQPISDDLFSPHSLGNE